jgi:hypothetical protein
MLFPPDGGWDKIFFLTAAKRIGDTEDTERGDAYSNHQEGGFGAIGFEGGDLLDADQRDSSSIGGLGLE